MWLIFYILCLIFKRIWFAHRMFSFKSNANVPYGDGVMSTLKCQLDWVIGYSGSWLDITSGCVGEGIFRRD